MNYGIDVSTYVAPVDLMSTLRSSWLRDKLKGKRVAYRTRWDRANERGETIGKVGHETIWIGAAFLHHDDIVSLREI